MCEPRHASAVYRAGNGTRTRDPNLGKVVLYQLSYSRMTCYLTNTRQGFLLLQPPATPVVPPAMEARGIEPLTS